MTKRCDLTELLVTDCAHCKRHMSIEEQAATEQTQLRTRLLNGEITSPTTWFRARFPGRCTSCGNRFGEGTAIRSLPDGYLAECCAEEPQT